jgi:hypothetical protein
VKLSIYPDISYRCWRKQCWGINKLAIHRRQYVCVPHTKEEQMMRWKVLRAALVLIVMVGVAGFPQGPSLGRVRGELEVERTWRSLGRYWKAQELSLRGWATPVR